LTGKQISRPKIADRKIPVLKPEGRGSVTVSVYAPVKQEGRGWWCNYQISFLDRKVQRSVNGADSLHALMLALEGMQAEVLAREQSGDLVLDWKGSKFKMSPRMRAIWKPKS
jgi:hypothetical protein